MEELAKQGRAKCLWEWCELMERTIRSKSRHRSIFLSRLHRRFDKGEIRQTLSPKVQICFLLTGLTMLLKMAEYRSNR